MVSNTSTNNPDSLLRRMASLADPVRLRLVHLLQQHELGVAEMCDILQLPQSTVSRHLKVLADERWTRSRRAGTNHLYRVLLDELDPAARKLWLLAREQTTDWSAIRQDELRLDRVLRARQEQSQTFFAGTAGDWDKLREETYGRTFSNAAALALLSPTMTVADLGCGTGHLAAQLAPFVRQVIGVDSSAAMLKAAKKRTEDLTNIDLRRGDLASIPIDTATADAALLVLVLSYLEEPALALREAARILKPGGRLVIVDLLPHDRDDFRRQMNQRHAGFDTSQLTGSLKAAGFSQVQIHPLATEPEAKGPALFLASATKPPMGT